VTLEQYAAPRVALRAFVKIVRAEWKFALPDNLS